MSHRLRRLSALLIAGGVVLIAIPATSALAAVSAVEPVGPVTVTVTNLNFMLTVAGTPSTVGPFHGELAGAVDETGNLSFPKAGISFEPFTGTIGPVDATVEPVATGDWSGTVDPESGVTTITGPLQTLATVPVLATDKCPLGPFTINTTTTSPGGKPYAAGVATTADPAYAVPAIPDGAPGCAGQESVINASLALPGTGGVVLTATFDPVLTGSGVVPSSTTTIKPVTTTVAPATTVPTTAAAELPRTGGSSSTPLAILGVGMLGAGLALALRRRRTPAG